MLRRIRFELIDRVLRFPPAHFKRVKQAEIATMIKDEVEPMGGFTGDAYVTPALLGGQAITALVFIIMQNFWLGMIAAGIVAVQAIVIPRTRKRLLELGRQRQLTARELSGRVGEIVEGIGTITPTIRPIRACRYRCRLRVDLLDPLRSLSVEVPGEIHQHTSSPESAPFLFYSIGGFLALQGRLDIGQLVAVINAYKDLPGPLKELIDWDQSRQNVQVKYNRVVEQFSVDGLIDAKIQVVSPAPAGPDHPLAGRDQSSCARRQRRSRAGSRLGRDPAWREGGYCRRQWRWWRIPRGGVRPACLAGYRPHRDRWPRPAGTAGIADGSAHCLCLVGYVLLPRHVAQQSSLWPKTRAAHPADYDDLAANKLKWQMIEARRAGNPELDL